MNCLQFITVSIILNKCNKLNNIINQESVLGVHESAKYRFQRQASHVPNALETIDNEAFQLTTILAKI
jgi:hypothetical protein